MLPLKLCAPSAVCFGEEECDPGGPSRRARGSGGLGAPQALSHADSLSLQPDWALPPCAASWSDLKKKFVVQFECVLVCLPSVGTCVPSESGAEFLGRQLCTACF